MRSLSRFHHLAVLGFVLLGSRSFALDAAELLPADKPGSEVIDDHVNQKLVADKIQAAKPAIETTLVRRLTLDLAGRIPTTSEARVYVESTEPDKRLRLVDKLLGSPDFAYHQRNELDAMLLASKKNDEKWRDFLLQAVRENRPWDQLFRQFMTGAEDKPEEQPALAFLKARARSLDDMTNDTSSLFFGVSINCAKCHDHPLVEDWKQDHFFGMSSFFSRTYLTKKDTLAEKYSGIPKFKTTAGEEKQAQFMFLTGTVIEEPKVERTKQQQKEDDAEVKRQMKDAKAPPPKPPAFSPRAELVQIALKPGPNRFFARSIVNRIWARLMGQGLVDPLDQMHSENPASHPQLLEWLSRDLIAHKYNLKRLIRHIVLSDTYARSSRWEAAGEPPSADTFAVAIPRVVSPRQYSLSLLIATSNPASFPADRDPKDPQEWSKRREQLEKASSGFAGQIELPTEHFQVSVDEALLFSNSERVQNDFLRDSGDKLVGALKEIKDRSAMIEAAFWAVLSRPPEPDERKAFEAFLTERSERPVVGIRQMVWALITSPELRFNY